MSIKLAVFDIAGTTVADEHAVAMPFAKHLNRMAMTDVTEEDVKPLMGYKKPDGHTHGIGKYWSRSIG